VIDESRGETRRGIEQIEVACGIPSLMMGYNLEDVASGIDEYVINQPVGVFGVIAPYNFPFMVPLWSVPYAVAAGNCVIVKPSPEDPISQVKLMELAEEAGFPPGVWNMVNGRESVVDGLLDSPLVSGITFVGSTRIANLIYERCGKLGKRCLANGEAKNFLTVMPDCNVEKTIPALMSSFFGNTGQRCLAGANLVIVGEDDKFYSDFVDRVVAAASRIVAGYGLDESVQMGTVKDKRKKDRIVGCIESGIQAGARLLLDGRRPVINGGYPDTCFIGPTVFSDVTLDMKIARDEIFGPVMNIMRAKDLDEAIAMTNTSAFGNAAGIFASNGGYAREFQYRVAGGNCGINVGVAAPMAFFPFGGMKGSFFGILHAQGKDIIRFFTDTKVVIQRWL
jgi:malonate-semialdehyde dehydrogenase (acetylating)/methylmalonate-semialdehyde dehydrogenase